MLLRDGAFVAMAMACYTSVAQWMLTMRLKDDETRLASGVGVCLSVARALTPSLSVLDLQLSTETQARTAAGLPWQQGQHKGVGCDWLPGGSFRVSSVAVASQTARVMSFFSSRNFRLSCESCCFPQHHIGNEYPM